MTFPITAVCGLLWLRLVIGDLGTSDYALIAVVVGLQFFLYLLDFGTASTVLEEAGRYRALGVLAPLGSALGRAWRVIVVGNLALLVLALGLAVAGTWGPILGFPDRTTAAGLAVVLTLTVNLVARPLSLATALVAGLGRPAVATWAQALAAVLSLCLVTLCLATSAPIAFVATTPIAAQALAGLVPLVVSARAAPGLMRAGVREAVHSSGTGPQLRRLAVPMLLIQVIAPLGSQLDRIVLSHLSTVEAVAVFSLAAQLFASAESFITVLQAPLWAEYAQQRARGGMRMAVLRSFGYVRRIWPFGLALGVTFAVGAYVLGPVVADGQLHLSWALCATLGGTLPLFALQVVLGIALTDPRGLRAQVGLLVCTTALNLALTVALVPPLGPVGPAMATLVTAAVFVPLLYVLARRRLREEPSGDAAARSPSEGEAGAPAEVDAEAAVGGERPSSSVPGPRADG